MRGHIASGLARRRQGSRCGAISLPEGELRERVGYLLRSHLSEDLVEWTDAPKDKEVANLEDLQVLQGLNRLADDPVVDPGLKAKPFCEIIHIDLHIGPHSEQHSRAWSTAIQVTRA